MARDVSLDALAATRKVTGLCSQLVVQVVAYVVVQAFALVLRKILLECDHVRLPQGVEVEVLGRRTPATFVQSAHWSRCWQGLIKAGTLTPNPRLAGTFASNLPKNEQFSLRSVRFARVRPKKESE